MIEFTLLSGELVYIAKRKIVYFTRKGDHTHVSFGNNNSFTIQESVQVCVQRYRLQTK